MHLEHFSTLYRDSGTEDERRAAQYITERITEYGVAAEILDFDCYISWPREGALRILGPKGGDETIPVRPRAFGSASHQS